MCLDRGSHYTAWGTRTEYESESESESESENDNKHESETKTAPTRSGLDVPTEVVAPPRYPRLMSPSGSDRDGVSNPTFLQFVPEARPPESRGAPRLSHTPKVSHTKSRTGCQRCKARRVKV
jgi:hypothetical protein